MKSIEVMAYPLLLRVTLFVIKIGVNDMPIM